MTSHDRMLAESDVLIVGAGIVGLAHAAEALRHGLTVTVIDRDSRAVGASVRNFGHCCVTAQSGELLDFALVARERWLHYSELAGFFSVSAGALAVARSAEELAVLDELAGQRESGQVQLLAASEVEERLSGDTGSVVGGALLRDDLRVDPREAVGALAAWLQQQPGVRFFWRTSYLGGDGDSAITSRGTVRATRTIVCVGHDLDYLFPELAEQHEVRRCGLQMARVEAPRGIRIAPAVLTGTSMLRYPAFTETGASPALRAKIGADDPGLIDIDANVMFTQRPDGSLLVGDSHRYDLTMDSFQREATSELLLDRIAQLLGVDSLRVVERWQGVYASSPQHPYLVEEPLSGVSVVSVTSGVGMTISFGLAKAVFDGLG
ncbi:TIGR03364 family FAD-dependent oxidoreductase [Glaciihabitans sp. UYNi722]|uniref:TIGR03364 family FAD-dependent oxidoreductase n=1 Tax=Glaciihabitans sp. UYNi722 TaxID=3156344 RepID=UPI0033923EDD